MRSFGARWHAGSAVGGLAVRHPPLAALFGTLIAALFAALLVVGCGGQSGAQDGTAQIGTDQIRTGGSRLAGLGDAFAGATWTGDVRSVGAAWQVPAIRAGSQAGRAATWIGAQAIATTPGTSFAHTPFIQIGTREELDNAGGQGDLFDEAFWSDTQQGLRPLSLIPVHPGDTVDARMSLAGGAWTLSITDQTSGRSKRVSTGQEAGGQFGLALWLQEDPTDTTTNRVFAYPDLTAVHFSSLTVNATRPADATLKTTWMKLPHAYLGPTAPAGGAFSVLPRTLSRAGARYLSLANAVDGEVNRFLAELLPQKSVTSGAQPTVRSATEGLITALSASVVRLRAARWPAGVARLIRRLASVDAGQIPALRRVLNRGRIAVLEALGHGTATETQTALGLSIRRGLGLPLFSY